jgi:hypothetical protein
MRSLTAIRIGLVLAGGFVAMALLFELALWLLPTYNDIFAADPDSKWPVHHLVPTDRFTYSAEWNFRNVRHGSINSMGYVAPFEYRTEHALVAIMGDSYVESTMNAYEDTMQSQLASARHVDASSVLNFGVSGSALPDYLGIGPMVRDRFHPQWVVVFVNDGDYVEGFGERTGHFIWAPGDAASVELVPDQQRGIATKVFRRLALVRYLRANLHFSLHRLFHTNGRPAEESGERQCPPSSFSSADMERVRHYVGSLPAAFGVPPARVILLHDSEEARLAMYMPAAVNARCPPSRDDEALSLLLREAKLQGMNVVDTVPLFRRHYEKTGMRVDYSPIDWHWNATAHRIAARAISEVIDRAEH